MLKAYDVLIIGGGISGCLTGMLTAKGGAKVLIVDRKNEIASPLRGGEAFCKPFYDILTKKFTFLKDVPRWELRGTKMVSKNFEIVNKEPKWLAYIIERRIFEKKIALEAVKSGCDISLGTTLKDLVFKNGFAIKGVVDSPMGARQIFAKVFVGADGYASRIRQILDLPLLSKDLGTAVEIEMAGLHLSSDDFIQIFVGEVPGGYTYIFPKGDGRAAAGAGVRPLINDIPKRSPLYYFNMLKNKIPEMKTQLKNGVAIEIKGGCIDVSGPLKCVHKNVLLVGDSANQNFAYVGEGILPSMIASEICSAKILEYLGGQDLKALASYEKDFFNSEMGIEVLSTIKIKDAINKILASAKSKEYKQFFTALLEMEIINSDDKSVERALKNKSVSDLVAFAKKQVCDKNMAIEIIAK